MVHVVTAEESAKAAKEDLERQYNQVQVTFDYVEGDELIRKTFTVYSENAREFMELVHADQLGKKRHVWSSSDMERIPLKPKSRTLTLGELLVQFLQGIYGKSEILDCSYDWDNRVHVLQTYTLTKDELDTPIQHFPYKDQIGNYIVINAINS